MNRQNPDYWNYTRNQRLGLLVLALLLVGLTLTARLIRSPAYEIPEVERSAFLAAVEKMKATGGAAGATSTPRLPAARTTPENFAFDPNTISPEDLQRLGLSKKQAASFVKYRARAPFRRVEDIGKLFVLKEDQKQKLIGLAEISRSASPESNFTPDRENSTGESPDYRQSQLPPASFAFDPNTVSTDSLQLLGLSEKQAAAFVKYRQKAPFRTAEDIGKLFVLQPEQVDRLSGLVEFVSPSPPGARSAPSTDERSPVSSIDVNRASPEQWQTLPGIGAYRAARIVKFRDLLGGFSNVEQVGTVYGMPDSTFRQILPYLTASPVNRRLPINKINAEELARHPYLKLSVARVIVRYRDNHGPFSNPEDLKKVIALTDENLARLLPYLNFE